MEYYVVHFPFPFLAPYPALANGGGRPESPLLPGRSPGLPHQLPTPGGAVVEVDPRPGAPSVGRDQREGAVAHGEGGGVAKRVGERGAHAPAAPGQVEDGAVVVTS